MLLRILGDGTSYEVMTATADEDDKRFLAPAAQDLLIDLACQTAEALGVVPLACRDRYGRPYIKISVVRDDQSANQIFETFLGLIDKATNDEVADSDETGRELQDIYDAISPDGSGEPAYLGDGLWLDGNGKLSDRGR